MRLFNLKLIPMGYQYTAPVGSYSPNDYGLYDMGGNVWEWCMDEYNSDYYAKSPRENPVAGGLISFVNDNFTTVKTTRVIRGGSWGRISGLPPRGGPLLQRSRL